MSNIAPTKSNLLKLKDELKFASLGYDLLDQKRNILVLELPHLVDQAVDYQSRVEKSLAEAYTALRRASMDMGKLQVARITRVINVESGILIKQRRVMGVQLPVVETEYIDHSPYFSPTETSFWVDGALKEFKRVLEMMGRLAELKVSIMRLAVEVKKTIRKVNALEKIAIPDLKKSVEYIRGRLEETERDSFVLMKMVKERLEKKED